MTQLRDRPAVPTTSHHPPSRPARRWGSAVVAVAVPAAVLAWHQALYGRWIVDDAAITFAYARSITDGAGPVLQPGAAAAEGWSNPAWLGLLMLGRWLGLFDQGAWFGVPDLVVFPKVLALALCTAVFAGFLVICRAARVHYPAVTAAGAGVVAALVPSFAIWTASGLENSLLAAAAVGLAAVLTRAAAGGRLLGWDTAVWSGALAAVAALTRPDGLVYAAAYPLAVLLLARGPVLRAAAAMAASTLVFAAPVGGYLWWRVVTFGQWLPNTALAKSQGTPDLASLQRPTELVTYGGWLLVLVAVGFVGAALARPSRARTVLVAALVPLALALGAFAVLNADWMGEYRFATPVWPLAAVSAAVGAAVVLPHLAVRARAATVLVVVVAAAVTGLSWQNAAAAFRVGPTVPMCGVAQNMGATPNALGRIFGIESGAIVTPDVGGAALASRYQVVDLAGLTDPVIAGLYRDGDMAGLRDHLLDVRRPEFIETHGGWSDRTGIVDDPRFVAGWVPVYRWAEQSGWWVRADLTTPATLAAATAHAETVGEAARRHFGTARRSSCGDTLTPDTEPVLGGVVLD